MCPLSLLSMNTVSLVEIKKHEHEGLAIMDTRNIFHTILILSRMNRMHYTYTGQETCTYLWRLVPLPCEGVDAANTNTRGMLCIKANVAKSRSQSYHRDG